MTSIRLTVFRRQNILRKVVEYTFDETKKKIENEEISLVDKCFRYTYSQKELDLMNSLPKGWLSEIHNFWVNAGGQQMYFYLKPDRPDSVRCVPHNIKFVVPFGTELCTDIQKFAQRKQKFEEEQRLFSNKFMSFLRSFSTLKRLKEEMPELEQIMGKEYFQDEVAPTSLVPFKTELVNMISAYNPNLEV